MFGKDKNSKQMIFNLFFILKNISLEPIVFVRIKMRKKEKREESI